jgi:putative ABC transport system ATP-binding protein
MLALLSYNSLKESLDYRGVTRKERDPIVLKALDAVDMVNRRKHLPSELSGGQ